jgi:hypothetical protein
MEPEFTLDGRTILDAMYNAKIRAWKSLAGYKFLMFGYHAARWVNYNKLLPANQQRPNPFRDAVRLGREKC